MNIENVAFYSSHMRELESIEERTRTESERAALRQAICRLRENNCDLYTEKLTTAQAGALLYALRQFRLRDATVRAAIRALQTQTVWFVEVKTDKGAWFRVSEPFADEHSARAWKNEIPEGCGTFRIRPYRDHRPALEAERLAGRPYMLPAFTALEGHEVKK